MAGPTKRKKLKKSVHDIEDYDKDVFDPGFGKKTKIVNYKPKVYKDRAKWDADMKSGKVREGDRLKEKMPLSKKFIHELKVAEKYKHLPYKQYRKKVSEELKRPWLVKGEKD